MCAGIVDAICSGTTAAEDTAHLEAVFGASLAVLQQRTHGGAAEAEAEHARRAVILRLFPAFFLESAVGGVGGGGGNCGGAVRRGAPASFGPRLASAAVAGLSQADAGSGGMSGPLLVLCRLPGLAASLDPAAAAAVDAALRRAVADRSPTVRKRAAHLLAALCPGGSAGGGMGLLGGVGWTGAQWRAAGDVLDAAEDTSSHLVAAAWAAALPALAPRRGIAYAGGQLEAQVGVGVKLAMFTSIGFLLSIIHAS